MESENAEFAFGANSVDGCKCPVLSVDQNPKSLQGAKVAETFDNIVRRRNPTLPNEGTISRSEAEVCFRKTMEKLKKDQHKSAELAEHVYWKLFE